MKYARMENGSALEVFVPQDGFTLADSFHPDVAALFSEVPEDVVAGSVVNEDGTWTHPEPVEPVAPAPEEGLQQDAPDVAA